MAQATQSGRQAGALLLHKGSNLSQAGSQVVTSHAGTHLPSGEGSNLSQAGSQAVTSQAGALLPPGKASSLSQAVNQAGTHLPLGEGSNSSQAGSQAGALLPLGEGSNVSQAGEGSSISVRFSQLLPWKALIFPLGKLAIYLRQAVRQALTFLPGKEAVWQQAVRLPRPPRWQVGW